ncbi:CBY1-interacting BAR domain-containing protein 1-like [Porites lutea]|uniref:CBY1-interacting BAR domain-containing protein 1-like n=1 Tax=Porites lutea TaxID=51062 RepID=UPI003CC5CECB
MKKSSSNLSASTPSEIRSETKARDHELKVITERINLAERHFNTLLKDFAALSTGLVSLQEKGMKLSKSVDLYSDEEYPSMKASLAGVSENIASLQDFLGGQAEFVHAKVSPPLSLNATNCKHAREYVKELNATREKEILKRKALDKVKTKEPRNKGKPFKLEQDLQKLTVDANRARQTLEEQMIEFERKKMEDIKTVFSNFFHGQMYFHAKALELYTTAIQNLVSMDEEQDIEAFQNDLHSAHHPTRLDVVRDGSQTSLNRFSSQGSLGSQMSLNKTGRSDRGADGDDDDTSDFE